MIISDESQHVRIYDAEDSSEWPDWLHQKMKEKKNRAEFIEARKQT